MASADVVIARYQTNARLAFFRAVRKTQEDVRNHTGVPVDTHRLRRGLVSDTTDTAGDTMTAVFKSTAKSRQGGFDYPAYLDKVARVAPTKAKYLQFTVRGQFVSSSGFDNTHQGWWTEKVWENGQLWARNICRELGR